MSDAPPARKIIHLDMDAFFAAVEQRDRAALRGKPVAVGGRPEQRGVVAAASYEARKFGVRSAMPMARALRLCPELIVVKPRFDVYRAVSLQIREIMARYSDLIEPLSLDEAFLDVTANKAGLATATETARALRAAIYNETRLTASAGIAPNKFLAKVASDLNKPNGQATIPPEQVGEFMRTLPVSKIYGIGPVTAERLAALGVHTAGDLQGIERKELVRLFGKASEHYWRIARGIDERPVEPNRRRKSVSAETTFAADISDLSLLRGHLSHLAERVSERLAKADARGRTITLKLRYDDFSELTRSRTLDSWVDDAETLIRVGCELLRTTEAGTRPVRLLGLGVHNLDDADADNSRHNAQLRLEL